MSNTEGQKKQLHQDVKDTLDETFKKFAQKAAQGVAVASFMAALASLVFTWYSKPKPTELQDRIATLSQSLNTAAKDVAAVEAEIQARQKLVEKMKSDAETAQAISALNAKQTEAIAQSLRGQLEQKEKEGYWWSIAQNVFFAALGAAFGEGWRLWQKRRRPEENDE